MFKKIALVAAVAASASFATYSYFPVGDANKGEATIGPGYYWHDDWSMMQINANVKYNVIQNLELSLQGLGYQLWSEDEHCDDNGAKCPDSDGLLAMTVGARYQFMPILIAALDVKIPLNSEDAVGGKYDPLGFYGAIQYTQELVSNLYIGSELGLTFDLEDEDLSHGLVLTLQAELDYSIASIGLTPWIGFAFNYKLTDDEYSGVGKWEDHSGDNGFTIWLGAQYDINTMFGVKANFIINTGDSMSAFGGDNKATGVNGALVIRF